MVRIGEDWRATSSLLILSLERFLEHKLLFTASAALREMISCYEVLTNHVPIPNLSTIRSWLRAHRPKGDIRTILYLLVAIYSRSYSCLSSVLRMFLYWVVSSIHLKAFNPWAKKMLLSLIRLRLTLETHCTLDDITNPYQPLDEAIRDSIASVCNYGASQAASPI